MPAQELKEFLAKREEEGFEPPMEMLQKTFHTSMK